MEVERFDAIAKELRAGDVATRAIKRWMPVSPGYLPPFRPDLVLLDPSQALSAHQEPNTDFRTETVGSCLGGKVTHREPGHPALDARAVHRQWHLGAQGEVDSPLLAENVLR